MNDAMNDADQQSGRWADAGRLARLTRKELRETLRDRRTVITLVLMPLLVYPLISISFNKSVLLNAEQASRMLYVIGVASEHGPRRAGGLLNWGDQLLREQEAPRERCGPGIATSGTEYLLVLQRVGGHRALHRAAGNARGQ